MEAKGAGVGQKRRREAPRALLRPWAACVAVAVAVPAAGRLLDMPCSAPLALSQVFLQDLL